MTSQVTNLLFVYGTLRRGFRRHHFLRRLGAKWMGKGSIAAELLDLGEYPGAVRSSQPSAHVVGELYAFREKERTLKILDAVEGFEANAPQRALFKREAAEVTLANKERVTAWVYWLNHVSRPRRRIVSGDYAKTDHG